MQKPIVIIHRKTGERFVVVGDGSKRGTIMVDGPLHAKVRYNNLQVKLNDYIFDNGQDLHISPTTDR